MSESNVKYSCTNTDQGVMEMGSAKQNSNLVVYIVQSKKIEKIS